MIPINKKIAVISDIHIGEAARSRALCPGTPSSEMLEEDFMGEFERFVQRDHVTADILVVAGDITTRARSSEFLHASAFVQEVASLLKIDSSQIYFVPGNHDVDWTALKSGGTEVDVAHRWSQRYSYVESAETVFKERQSGAVSTLFHEPYACVWPSEQLLVAAINSASHDKPSEINDPPHHGRALTQSLQWLDAELAKHESRDNQLRIAIVHHHPISYSDPYPNVIRYTDFSQLQNAESLLKLMRKHRIDLIVHGHKHVPRFQTHTVMSDYPIHVLGAGSFSVKLEAALSGEVLNQFHLLSISARVAPGSQVVGTLRNWALAGSSGWQQSGKMFTGIEHELGFGFFLSRESFRQSVEMDLATVFKSTDRLRWTDIYAYNEGYRYVPPHTIQDTLELYASENSLELLGSTIKDFILVGERI